MKTYVVYPTGRVLWYKNGTLAEAVRQADDKFGAVVATDEDISQVRTSVLVTLHNLIRPEKPVTRFSDRETAEKRMKGVLEVLAKPGEPVAPQSQSQEQPTQQEPTTTDAADAVSPTTEDADMATKTKGSTKKRTTTKTTPRANAAAPISEATVKRCIKARADGKGWPEILKDIGEKPSFVLRVRPLMKAMDKASVRKLNRSSK